MEHIEKENCIQPVIEIKNVSIDYAQSIVAKNISFRLQPQESLLLDALAGSGKSTLIETILGFRPLVDGGSPDRSSVLCSASCMPVVLITQL